MKIGILTFHAALNAGAVLQAYALQYYLANYGHDVEIIDYRMRRHYRLRNFIGKSLRVTVNRWHDLYNGYKYAHNDMFTKCLKIGKIRYHSEKELRKNMPKYDLYIVGSDQVWNFNSRLMPVYLFSFLPQKARRVAYAVSMGGCDVPVGYRDYMRKELLRFEAIGMREDCGVQFITKLISSSKPVCHVVDPVFLIQKSAYEVIIANENMNGTYICSYILSHIDLDHYSIIAYVREYFAGISHINLRNPDTGVVLSDANNYIVDPIKWLSYIRNARFVICGSFHAVAFSLIFHRPFLVLSLKSTQPVGANERIASLLKPLGLMNRCFALQDISRLTDILNQKINWYDIDCKLRNMRDKSHYFLADILKN